jgi:hypothetical protein
MDSSRIFVLGGIAACLCALVVWRWVSGWGLVTLDYTDVPLSKVIKSIESQGRVKIATNADLSTPVTILLKRAPVYEAIDTLAIRLDGDARLAYVAAPDKKQIAEVLSAFTSGTDPGTWAVFSVGFGGGRMGGGETVTDPRQIEWKVGGSPDKNLQTLLGEGSQKTGALFATPRDWNPALGKLPSGGKTGKVVSSLVSSVRGQVRELFLITVRPPRPEGERNANQGRDRWEGQRTVFSPRRGNRNSNPEWMAERVQAQIATLPAEERADARKQFDDMRKFWESVRNLPEDQRREKFAELMNDPAVQERMENRMSARDSKRSPKQREQRMKNYLERKQQMKETAGKS